MIYYTNADLHNLQFKPHPIPSMSVNHNNHDIQPLKNNTLSRVPNNPRINK